MKYAVVLLALVAAASAQLNDGRYNAYNPFNKVNQYSRYNPYTTPSPFRYRPAVTVSPIYPSSTPAPYVSSTIAPLRLPVSVESRYAPDAVIIRSGNDLSPDGSYSYFYETSNGIAAQEQGTPRVFAGNPPVAPVVAQGSFSWTSPEGIPIAISYIADENGYQPSGDALPTPPPIPAQILRALEYISSRNLKK